MTTIIYTDGSCEDYIGGWAVLVIENKKIFEYSGHLSYSTNNIAELTAIYQALLIKNDNLIIKSDSMYSINSLTIWGNKWEKNKWKKADGNVPENVELIKQIRLLLKGKNIKFQHVYGHNGDKYNERVDLLAKLARQQKLFKFVVNI